MFGQLTIINLRECDGVLVKNPFHLKKFLKELCVILEMVPYGSPIVKRFGEGNLEGYTGIQLIETSNITVHLDDFKKRAFIDIFSCKKFDKIKVKKFAKEYFKAKKAE